MCTTLKSSIPTSILTWIWLNPHVCVCYQPSEEEGRCQNESRPRWSMVFGQLCICKTVSLCCWMLSCPFVLFPVEDDDVFDKVCDWICMTWCYYWWDKTVNDACNLCCVLIFYINEICSENQCPYIFLWNTDRKYWSKYSVDKVPHFHWLNSQHPSTHFLPLFQGRGVVAQVISDVPL